MRTGNRNWRGCPLQGIGGNCTRYSIWDEDHCWGEQNIQEGTSKTQRNSPRFKGRIPMHHKRLLRDWERDSLWIHRRQLRKCNELRRYVHRPHRWHLHVHFFRVDWIWRRAHGRPSSSRWQGYWARDRQRRVGRRNWKRTTFDQHPSHRRPNSGPEGWLIPRRWLLRHLGQQSRQHFYWTFALSHVNVMHWLKVSWN